MTEIEFKNLEQDINKSTKDHKNDLFTRQQLHELSSTLFSLGAISLLAYIAVVVL